MPSNVRGACRECVRAAGPLLGRCTVCEDISGTAFRMNERRPRFFVDLSAQSIDVDLDGVGERIVIVIPDVRDDVSSRDDLTRVTGQQFEQRVFLGGEGDRHSGARDGSRECVDLEVRDAHLDWLERLWSPQQRTESREELAEIEWLREIIVGTGIQSRDAIGDGIARRQHQDWRPDATAPQFATDRQSIHARQHDIEHDGVVAVHRGLHERVAPVARDIDGVGDFAQPPRDDTREFRIIFDNEETHCGRARGKNGPETLIGS